MTNAELMIYDVDNVRYEYAHGRMTAVEAVQRIKDIVSLKCDNCFYLVNCTSENHYRCEDGYKAFLEANT